MNNTYNNNMYLSTEDLNDFENEIETITEEIRENIFDSQVSPLRNIVVGDNLNGKTLYLSIPRDFYENITENVYMTVITTDNSNLIECYRDSYFSEEDLMWGGVISYKNVDYYLYEYTTDSETNIEEVNLNKKYFTLPRDFGIVNYIDTTNPLYQYMKIYGDETIIPDYEKHVWSDNEILSMQKIDNIEKGIKNIGEYYYKPSGWITAREWLPMTDIDYRPTHTNIQNISYQDLNRWLTDLSLINFEDLDKMTIWNSVVSEIDWNMQNNTDWEDL